VTAGGVARRLLGSLRRRRAEVELEEEIGFHLAMETEENIRRGLPPERARRAAERSFGRRGHAVDDAHRARGLPWLDDVAADAGLALRTLRRAPGFSVAVILLVALGIGANAAVFTVVDGVLLRPLPYPRPDQLALLQQFRAGETNMTHDGRTVLDLERWNDQTQTVAAIGPTAGVNLVRDSLALHVRAQPVSRRYLEVMGVGPERGRGFEQTDERAGAAPVVILGHDLARRIGGDLVGQRLVLSGVSHTVAGVLPRGFRMFPPADLLIPLHLGLEANGTNYTVIGRLRGGDGTATQRLAAATAALHQAGSVDREIGLRWTSLRDDLSELRRPTLLLLFGAVGLVLLIACANVAGLLLIKAQRRAAELAVRSALGAGPGRLVRQLLTEGMVYALAGGLVGIGLAHVALVGLLRLAPSDLTDWGLGIDGRVLLFSLGLTILTGVACALAPAVRASRVDLRQAVTGGASGVAASAPRSRWRRGLLVGQVALCTLLLLGAGLLTRTLVELRRVDPGFHAGSIVAMTMSPDQSDSSLQIFYARALAEAGQVPGVRRIALTSGVPGRRVLNLPLEVPGTDAPLRAINWRYVSPGYFEMLGIELESGRFLGDRDSAGAQPVTVVNRAFARLYFPDGEPIGRQVRIARFAPEDADPPRTIVGVVGDTRDVGLTGDPEPSIYVAVAQVPPGLFAVAHRFFDMCWLIDTDLSPAIAANRLGGVFRSLQPGVPFSEVTSLEDVLGAHMAGERFLAWLLAAFALAALCIAITGIYGLTAYSVSQRSREIAIRMALGASPGRVLRGILGEAVVVAVVGVVVGLAAAWPLGPVLRRFLRGAASFDPATSAAVAAVLLSAAVLASLVPATRAARIDPVTNLRQG